MLHKVDRTVYCSQAQQPDEACSGTCRTYSTFYQTKWLYWTIAVMLNDSLDVVPHRRVSICNSIKRECRCCIPLYFVKWFLGYSQDPRLV
jgi:hypothetical protein